jgi:hypothetical protein
VAADRTEGSAVGESAAQLISSLGAAKGFKVTLDHNTMRRLAFIRYLYQVGIGQSQASAPLNGASVLTFHDAVELFLQLASEHLNSGAGQPSFMDYWGILDKKLDDGELAQKESMRRLNKARVALKHHGTLPSDLDIEAFRGSVTAFFLDNTPLVFGIQLDEVSLVEFVSPASARRLLEEANQLLDEGNTLDAMDKVAMSFADMIDDYEDRKRDRFGGSPFFFGKSLTFQSSFFMGTDKIDRKLSEFVDRVKESLEAQQDAIKMLALGIDYRKYSRFKRLTPILIKSMGGTVVQRRQGTEVGFAPDDVRFCIDFVIESALALSEFDYSIDPEPRA